MSSARAIPEQVAGFSPDPGRQPAALRAAAPVHLGLVIPTLREAANISAVLDRAIGALDALGISYELIVVDDDSRDGTEFLVKKLTAAGQPVRFLCRKGEHGLGSAVLHGWQTSEAEVLGVMDADLQHPPELLPALWRAVEAGSDLALASRYVRGGSADQWNFARHFLSRAAITLTQPLQRRGISVKDPMSGFFLVRRSCIRDVRLQTKGFKLLLEILVRGDIQSASEVPFTFACRQSGSSKAGIRVGLDYLRTLARLWRQRRAD